MAFEHERKLWFKVVKELPVRYESMRIWQETCFPQMLLENHTYGLDLQREFMWGWARELIPDRYVADAVVATFWKIQSRFGKLFVPDISPQMAATSAVHGHLTAMSELTPVPVVDDIRWIALKDWTVELANLHPVWRARYDAAGAELWTHSEDMPDLWRQLAFGHLQTVSEPAYLPAYKWLRIIWVQALWEMLNGVSGTWHKLIQVAAWGYLPVGLAANGRTFIVSSKVLP
jgi:hypothetical protein